MSVVAGFRVSADAFELGRILRLTGDATVELVRLVPLGETAIPLFCGYQVSAESLLDSVRRHPSVEAVEVVEAFDDRTLFSFVWDATHDHLIRALRTCDGHLLSALGAREVWRFEVRFPSRDRLSEFQTQCENAGIALEVYRVNDSPEPGGPPWYALSEPQREALGLAVRMGYYDIPRRCTTKELAEELGISDQAVTERLRRAIVGLTERTYIAED